MLMYTVSTDKLGCSTSSVTIHWNVLGVGHTSHVLTLVAGSISFSRSVESSGTCVAIVATARKVAKEFGTIGSTFDAWVCQMSC